MLETVKDIIIGIDHNIWYYLNVLWHNPVFDAIMPYVRNQWTWAPLYIFLAVFMPLNFGRRGAMWCVFFILTFSLSDYASASILKPVFQRLRPCNNPELTSMVHLLVPCGSGLSFPSSHAANHFALAVFSAVTLKQKIKGIWFIAVGWALLVAYAQVYVGVHFPIDVISGGIIGSLAGLLTGNVFKRIYNLNALPLPATGEHSA